ncbi:MAG: FMN-binding protein [Oscillospiraceae bacterium]|nr:FMN-binding protein [Oscillospiraceae bacterium]
MGKAKKKPTVKKPASAVKHETSKKPEIKISNKKEKSITNFNFKPTLILAVITAAITLLLVLAQHVAEIYAEDENILTGKLKEKCAELMGEGEFEVILDWEEAGYSAARPKEILKLIIKDEKDIAFQVTAKGFNENGLNILVVMNNDGSVKTLAVIENKDTKGIGDKVENESFLNSFIGKSAEVRIIKGTPRSDSEIAAVTTATKSSKGVANAVNTAIEAYQMIFGE